MTSPALLLNDVTNTIFLAISQVFPPSYSSHPELSIPQPLVDEWGTEKQSTADRSLPPILLQLSTGRRESGLPQPR